MNNARTVAIVVEGANCELVRRIDQESHRLNAMVAVCPTRVTLSIRQR